jgi:hypothetical protein
MLIQGEVTVSVVGVCNIQLVSWTGRKVNLELATEFRICCCVVSGYFIGVAVLRFSWDVTEFRVFRSVVSPPSSVSTSLTIYVTHCVLAGNVA